jgi:hypothetical protein
MPDLAEGCQFFQKLLHLLFGLFVLVAELLDGDRSPTPFTLEHNAG